MFHESPMGQGDEPSSARNARSRVAQSKNPRAFISLGGAQARPYAPGRSLAFAAPNRAWQGCARARD